MNQAESRRRILELWAAHPERAESYSAKQMFYLHLEEHFPELLTFNSKADRWQVVKIWLDGGR